MEKKKERNPQESVPLRKSEKQRGERTEKTQNRKSKNSVSTTEGIPYN